MTHGKAPGTGRLRTLHSRRSGPGRRRGPAGTHRERGSGTVLAVGLALVVMMAMALMLLLAQSAVLASRAAAAADLAALAAADALRGLAAGEPCTVAAEVAARHGAAVLGCTEGAGQTVEVRTELVERTVFGAAHGRSLAGPPP
ncbi:Rv3654c family TadE-like protein [Pseudarthrobacter sp. WHRI 8279]|uniref:Rv3654c family TadE-like protein n=1 Tax=Pseudarthrobacter sp. WHRI 8279 TaxID=3162566 RepID=UPI0032EDA4BC